MVSVTADASEPERRLEGILAAYLEELEAGRTPDRAAWLARYPDMAGELSAFFANLDHMGRIADSLRDHDPPSVGPLKKGPVPFEKPELVGYFGDYELIREIDRGGMGVVYAARQVSLDRILALKMIPDNPRSSQAELRRFQLEAVAVASFDHPNIVPIYEVGQHDGHRYFSMKLVEGGSLATESPRLRGDYVALARLVATTARAIHYAHQRGILHRDLKPSNILLDRNDQPLIADFGLARRIEAERDLTCTGSIVGTPAYMAPEQAEGLREAVTTAVDVYGLGAIFYETLAGHPPLRGDSLFETLRRVRDEEPVSPSAIDPRVPRDLETICLKCLEKEPQNRYPTALAVAEDLERWLAGHPITARPSTVVERAVKWAKRRPTAAGLLVTGAIAVLAVTLAVREMRSAERFRNLADSAELKRTHESLARRLAEAEVARRINREASDEFDSYTGKIARARWAWQANDLAMAEQNLWECPPSLRRWEWLYLDRLVHSAIRTMKGRNGASCGVAFAPAMDVFCCPEDQGGVRIWDDRSDRDVGHVRGHDGFAYGVVFDREGKRLATAGSDGKIRLWEVAKGDLLRTMPGHAEWAAGVSFAHNDMWQVSGGADRVIRIWDAATGAEIRALRGHTGPVMGVAVRPDGRQIASAGQEGSIKLWDASTGREERTLPGHREAARCVAYSPDGLRLASGGADRHVRVWDLTTGQELLAFPAVSGRIDGLAFSPDGTRIATGGLDRTVKIWDAATGGDLASYRGHNASVFSVAFRSDGLRLASASQDGTVKIWDATSAPEARVLKGSGRSIGGLILSDDGAIVAVSTDQGVTAWDTKSGHRLWSNPAQAGELSPLAEYPGRHLAVTVGADHALQTWDLRSGESKVLLRGATEAVASLAINPYGRLLAIGDGNPNSVIQRLHGEGIAEPARGSAVRLWDLLTGRELLELKGHTGTVHEVRFSPDGFLFASAGGDGSISLWEVSSWKQILIFLSHRSSVLDLAFARDGSRLAATFADGTTRIWNVAIGQEIFTMHTRSTWILGVAFSPDGSRLVTASSDGAVELRDSGTGRILLSLHSHGGNAQRIAFSADGSRIAAAFADGTVWIWSAVSETHQSSASKIDEGARRNFPRS